jgi:UDP-2,3-diacylglucosamine pyrophosphatase LpxH
MIRRAFVSDVHMSAGWSLDGGSGRYDWLDAAEADNFAHFLTALNNDSSIHEVILLGDIMDAWVYPIDVRPPGYQQIVSASHIVPVIDSLRVLSGNKPVSYVRGNHDISITDDGFSGFRDTFFSEILFCNSYETADGIYAEHGHRHVMYNAADPNPAITLPLGHYISRLAATVEARKGQRCRQSEVTEVLFPSGRLAGGTQTLSGDLLVNLPLSYLAAQLDGVDDSTHIVTADGGSITLGGVREQYRNLSHKWAEKHGALDPLHSVWMEAEGFWGLVHEIAAERDKKVIIMGHTHKKELSYLTPPDPIVSPGYDTDPFAVYANCGSWCNRNDPHPKPYTYVVTEYDEPTGKQIVSLRYWGEEREPEVKVI